MNEHKDQATWFRVERLRFGRWEFVGDRDTRAEANVLTVRFKIGTVRVSRVSGLAGE